MNQERIETPGEPSLATVLEREPFRFDFFQAVRVLQKLLPQRQPVGHDALPSDEIIRFRSFASLSFPASELQDFIPAKGEDSPAEMVVTFMGLTGPSDGLPRWYTELILERARNKDRTLADFLDLFNHRLISLFYRAWEKSRFWACYERAEIEGRRWRAEGESKLRSFVIEQRPRLDFMSESLLNLAGLGPSSLRYKASVRDRLERRTSLEDETFRYFAGLLAQQRRSAGSLEGILADYFSLTVTVEQFCGQWLKLELENQSSLVPGGNVQLGANVVIGERFWDRQGKFRLRLGPLTYIQFCDFLPSGTAVRPLTHLVRLFAGQTFDVDAQLVLRADEVPECKLSSTLGGARLGWDTWIRSGTLEHDVSDACFLLHN
jgi:type VI secretion system protein ImpH